MNNLSERGIKVLASLGIDPHDDDMGICLRGYEKLRGRDSTDLPSCGPLFHICGAACSAVL